MLGLTCRAVLGLTCRAVLGLTCRAGTDVSGCAGTDVSGCAVPSKTHSQKLHIAEDNTWLCWHALTNRYNFEDIGCLRQVWLF